MLINSAKYEDSHKLTALLAQDTLIVTIIVFTMGHVLRIRFFPPPNLDPCHLNMDYRHLLSPSQLGPKLATHKSDPSGSLHLPFRSVTCVTDQVISTAKFGPMSSEYGLQTTVESITSVSKTFLKLHSWIGCSDKKVQKDVTKNGSQGKY